MGKGRDRLPPPPAETPLPREGGGKADTLAEEAVIEVGVEVGAGGNEAGKDASSDGIEFVKGSISASCSSLSAATDVEGDDGCVVSLVPVKT